MDEGGLGRGEDEEGAGEGEDARGPSGLHKAGSGVGVGAEEKVAEFVGDDVAEHVGVADAGMIAAEDEILVVDIGVDAVA